MANFRGTVQGNKGEASRLGHTELHTTAATWHHQVEVTLRKVQGQDICDLSCRDLKTGLSTGVTLPLAALPAALRKLKEILDETRSSR